MRPAFPLAVPDATTDYADFTDGMIAAKRHKSRNKGIDPVLEPKHVLNRGLAPRG